MELDVIPVYKRIEKACRLGNGIRLSWQEVCAIWHDGAVRQAVETADDEERRAALALADKEG